MQSPCKSTLSLLFFTKAKLGPYFFNQNVQKQPTNFVATPDQLLGTSISVSPFSFWTFGPVNNFLSSDHSDLSYNFITSLDSQYFFPKPNRLIYLLLRNNQIRELEESNLDIFTSLQVLDLESNLIAHIHPKAFSNLTNLRDL